MNFLRALHARMLHMHTLSRTLISGLCLSIPFYIRPLWFLIFAGAALFIWIAVGASSRKDAFFHGAFIGFFIYGSVLSGVGISLFPFDWYGIGHPLLQLFAVGMSWLFASVVFGSVFGVVAVCMYLLKTDSWFDVLLFPSVWIAGEFLSSWLYYFCMLGPGSFAGPHFTLAYVGYYLAEDSALLQLAALGGVYLLSFFTVATAAVIQRACTRKRLFQGILAALFLVWIAVHAASPYLFHEEASGNVLRTAVISRYLPPAPQHTEYLVNERFEEMLRLLAPLRDLDVVVFPENAAFMRELYTEERLTDRQEIVNTGKTARGPVLIDSSDSVQNGVFSSQVTFSDNVERSFGQKQFLLAFGEYMPYAYQFLLKTFSGSDALLSALQARNYVAGDEVPFGYARGALLAVRFCDEVMSPSLYRKQVQQGAEVLINISSLSWFHGSPLISGHMERIAKVRAVELGRYFVQSGNMAPAFVLDAHGKKIAHTDGEGIAVLVADVYPRHTQTPYVLWGEWLLFCAFMAIAFACVRRGIGVHNRLL